MCDKLELTIVFVLALLMVVACSEQLQDERLQHGQHVKSTPANPTSQPIDNQVAGIEWYAGSVEEAFVAAKNLNKPLLLYWGALWCPPCNELKATVFKQTSFIEKTRLFVPLYLDGDTHRAQIFGEKFAVKGYPTLIVFDAQGNEITRIPGGMELERYQTVLDLVLQKIKPVKSLVANAQNGLSLSAEDCTLLAYYSWSQDNQQALPAAGVSGILKNIHDACPAGLPKEKSRLFLEYLHAVIRESQTSDQSPTLISDEAIRQEVLTKLNNILTTPALVQSNVYYLRYEDGTTIQALTRDQSAERNNLLTNWHKALEFISGGGQFTDTERLGVLYARVSLHKIAQQGELTSAQQQAIKQTIHKARENINNQYEHSAIVNLMRNILVHAEMHHVAEQVITEEINNAASPYYFMLELADFAQKEGRRDEALNWYEKAYRQSAPGATRFQWGVYYLDGLTDLVPEQTARIRELSVELIQLLLKSQDGFYNRNIAGLQQMEQSLRHWNTNAERNQVIMVIRSMLHANCDKLDGASKGYQQCQQFLSPTDETKNSS